MYMESNFTNARLFLDAFVSVEKSLNRIVKPEGYVPYQQLIDLASESNRVVRNRMDSLKEYGELRNAIVHQRGAKMEIIAEPSDSVTKDIIRISHLLEKDQTILCYATQPVNILRCNYTVEEAFQLMKKVNLSKIPVYENGKCIGLLNMSVIASWLIEGRSKKATIKELIDAEGSERVVFINRYAHIQEVIEMFDQAMQKGNKAPVVLISEHGLPTEKPMGILASYDLTRIITMLA